MAKTTSDLARILAFLEGLVRDRFFGSVTITFQAGKPGTIKTEQVHKVDDMPAAVPAEEKR